jgi:predicted permease
VYAGPCVGVELGTSKIAKGAAKRIQWAIMLDLLNVLLPTFTAIAVGFFIGKFSKINLNGLVDLLFYVGVPALAFASMMDKETVLSDATKVWASALFVILGCGIAAWITFKIMRQKHSGVFLPIMMMNSVNIPFPILSMLFGAEGLSGAILFFVPDTIMVYSLGIVILSRKNWLDGVKEMAKVPAVYAAVIGLVLNLGGVRMPNVVLKQFNFTSFLRLGVGLGLGLLAVEIFDLTGVLRSVVIFNAAMPAAVTTSLLAMKYDNEPDLVASVVFVTTIASLIMMPFLIKAIT